MRIKSVSSLCGGEILAEPVLTEKNEIIMYTTQNGQMKVDTLDKKKEYNFDEFKRGIFNLRTNFGELAQIMIKKNTVSKILMINIMIYTTMIKELK